jgi:hypothetical protein
VEKRKAIEIKLLKLLVSSKSTPKDGLWIGTSSNGKSAYRTTEVP